jgi:hypothetical protein
VLADKDGRIDSPRISPREEMMQVNLKLLGEIDEIGISGNLGSFSIYFLFSSFPADGTRAHNLGDGK